MAQKTDLNVSPYYDDFDAAKNYYKVLFNPGRPIQARELTTLQSILQNQIESFGSHTFKEGSVVIPGNIAYDGQFYAVKLNPTNYGVDISLYIDKFVGKKITGQISGTTAIIQYISFVDDLNVDDLTIYVKYLDSDNNFIFNPFEDGESLVAEENITYGDDTINAGTAFASLISLDATSIGSAASIGDGVYFIRGYFVNVSKQTIILDNYTNTPSYRVGLKIDELLINSKDDNTLFDGAKGFTNYAAPGADRLQINLTLTKKALTDINDTDFVELLRVENGKVKKIESKNNFNLLRDYLADRTYDESGNYAVTPFKVSVHNSLNDRLGSNGLFFDNETTDESNTPSNDLMGIKVSPGKAYVRGYDVDKISTTIIDVEKPRDTEIVPLVNIPFEMGNILRVNSVFGSPKQKEALDLYTKLNSEGDIIGYARVYNINLSDTAYVGNNSNWDLYLYDIQTYTKVILNKSIETTELPVSSFVKGKSSGASGYVVSGGGSDTIILSQTSGSFSQGEQLIINGVDSARSVKSVTAYGTQNIKSVKQTSPFGGVDFKANAFLERFNFQNNVSKVTIDAGGTVTSAGNVFSGVRENTVIRYQKQGSSVETFNRVVSVNPTGLSMTVAAITSVSGLFDGDLPSGTIEPNIQIGAPILKNQYNGYLYSILPDSNISSVNLSNSLLTISAQIPNVSISGGKLSLSAADLNTIGITSAFFASFDEERYSVHYSGGGIGTVTSDRFNLSGNQVTISGLVDGTGATVNVTLVKDGIQSKKKEYNRSKILDVTFSKYSQSGISSSSSINDGLTYNQFYGLRVQDEEISLNYPDVCKVLAVYESYNSSSPSLDRITFTASADVNTNAIIGENIIGDNTKAIARVISKPSTNILEIVYLNTERFFEGETVKFEESNIIADIQSIIVGNYKDITYTYQLDKGQRDQYYDYSRLVRNKNTPEPSKKLLILFDYYSVPSNDTGDVFTVLSYDQERFTNDIPSIGPTNVRASDTLDFRPRVSVFDVANKSPFDFTSRDFNDSDPRVILCPNEASLIGYEYYLPRVDKLYLDKFGNFILEKGVSSKNPKVPNKKGDVMDIATITLPPYLYHPSDAVVTPIDNRRYTMRDIGIIQERVSNLERVTSLSLLEVNTQTLQIQDSDGRNRFKTGFSVDDFKDYTAINRRLSSSQINNEANELIPTISRNSLKSQLTPAIPLIDEQLDLSVNYDLLDPNVQKTGNAITLKYNSVDWIEQPFATRVENVNPFNVIVYIGDIKLDPDRDYWIRTIQLPDRHVSNSIAMPSINLTNNVSNNVITTSNSATNNTINRDVLAPTVRGMRNGDTTTSTVFNGSSISSKSSSKTSSSTEKNGTISDYDTTIQNIKVSSAEEKFIRSRNIEFSVTNIKPSTQFYLFFDSNSAVDFVPKLVEISNDTTLANYGASGSFVVGEEVVGTSNGKNLITFRVAKANHKYGSFSSPSSTYMVNPYIKGETLSSSYSSSSKVLNIDTYSLSQEAQGKYSGYLVKGMRLVGQTSGAVAYVKDLRLITDNYGDLIGTSFLRDPNTTPPPSVRIETGTKSFKLTSSSTNTPGLLGSNSVSYAESNYSADGMFEQWENLVTTTIRSTDVNTTTNTTTNTTNINLNNDSTTTVTRYVDPLAQSFVVGGNVEAPSPTNTNDDVNGGFLTAVDLYFASKDSGNCPVKVEIRTVELGTPTRNRIGNAVTLRPDQVNISNDAETATTITFDSPIYLAPGREYAVVIISETSDQYELWCATMNEKTINTKSLPDADSVKYTKQFSMGSLFKSQNGSIWTANQYQDLKFKLYKAEFTSPAGTAFFNNPSLDKSNGYIRNLTNNPLKTLPKTAALGITTIPGSNTTLIDTLSNPLGRKIVGSESYSYGYVVGAGSSVSTVGLTTGGSNYPETASDVSTYNIIGNGSGLKLNITSSNGVITSISPTNRGNGYAVGDVVGIVTSTVSGTANNRGAGANITINTIGGLDTLYLSGIQGNAFQVGAALSYYNNSAEIVSLASTTIRNFTLTGSINSGNYIKVDHFDHGMYSDTNKLVISGAESTVPTTTLSAQLLSTDVSIINLSDITNFKTFEGVVVSSDNPGYVKIENEVIRYIDVVNNTLTGIVRGIDSTIPLDYAANTLVSKYEMNGVSLRRINTNHDISDYEIGIDNYYIEIDRSANGTDRSSDLIGFPELSFTGESTVGGSSVYATSNISYNALVPVYDVITPGSTSVTATVRTVTGTSVSGNETSFLDNGFEPVQLNTLNVFDSVRIVCSKENEITYLTNLPRSKSFTTGITLNSTDKYLSPVIYLSNASTEFRNNRLDKPVSDYTLDSGSNSITNDPHAASYVSRLVSLTQPASCLKVILSAYRHSSADFRVLYSLVRADSSEVPQAFELFPGYNNLQYTNTNQYSVVDQSKNDGLPDIFVPPSLDNQFLEYQFTADNLDLFVGYVIKIVMSGTNQARPIRIKELRTIAVR